MPIAGPDVLLYEQRDRIITITLNRPERMNAISLELAQRLEEAWDKYESDDNAWVCILTGSGDKAFCSGWDLVDHAEKSNKGSGLIKQVPQYWPFNIWKPIIVALNGYTVAGGFQLAHSCDIKIAAEHAEFGISETRWNMPAHWVGSLTSHISLSHALEIGLWGDKRITAQRAYEIGLVNKVVPGKTIMEEARAWAERMLLLAPRAVRNIKETIYRGLYMNPQESLRFAQVLQANLEGMEDTIEGPKAFAEKRKPVFKNR